MVEFVLERRLSGGLHMQANKTASTAEPIRRRFLPTRLVLGLHQHRGAPARPLVAVGDRVLKGQLIGAPGEPPSAAVHASTSGRVRSIEERSIQGSEGLERSLAVVIETDGKDERLPAEGDWPPDRASRVERIRLGGIVGLGGAVFPTADKLSASGCKTLIVNGAECEPYISCDDMLMRESAAEIVAGALLMTDLLAAPQCIIAVERDKLRAVQAIAAATQAANDPRLKLAEVPTVYPAGGERQLVEVLTTDEVPSGRYPIDIGYVCQNVGTAFALHRMVTAGEPLISRVVTVTGGGVRRPQNVETPIGTPISELIALCGGYTDDVVRLIAGGSMMGYALPDDDIPIGKASNCIIAATAIEVRTDTAQWPCIRCGDCSAACPARLLPQELLTAAHADGFATLERLGLDDCIECGCCDVACPSQIALTETFRAAKRSLAAHRCREALSQEASQRFARREQRLASDRARDRDLQHTLQRAVDDPASREAAIREALERAKHKQEGP
jgi:H+/Na+-translocating ferredoxin:NAD+ oxidoreductase subunit C